MKIFQSILICILTFAVLSSCQGKTTSTPSGENSIYYWRTTFSLSDTEKKFLQKHNIRKMYIRFFDVKFTFHDINGEQVIPEATIKFIDSIPDGLEIIPTIYITTGAIQEMQLKEKEYAEKVLKRIKAICIRHEIDFREVQLDCDWTKNTRNPFFRLCEAMKSCMDSTMILSSTVRLHQLNQTPPPVDKGVLMVYNTGNLMEMTAENSIFSQKNIEPYLRDNRLSDYPLPLDVAYPTFGWSLVYYPGQDKYHFDRIMRRTDFSSYPALKKIGPNLYEAESEISFTDSGDYRDRIDEHHRVKIERPAAEEIIKVKKQIDTRLKGKVHNNILYHLDENQLSHYNDNEISEIYSYN